MDLAQGVSKHPVHNKLEDLSSYICSQAALPQCRPSNYNQCSTTQREECSNGILVNKLDLFRYTGWGGYETLRHCPLSWTGVAG